nr:Chain E, Large delta antigen [Hepatitis delta virus (ISOLATE ITALIAN)]5M5U_F Chain F, Large delta antigen [Hepatitis delta virus (ISOLATE ITALIAN)]5M5U_G Chain G, Large delta antigen [Hepatitis delta virus (ISOLATE ITALIAN)]5M5U_H Chain H, Large delta antigen [Hepatitis delta virus (ISOLATE ITALIAN)]
SDILFPADS